MDGVLRDCHTAWNRRFTMAPIGVAVFDSRLNYKVCTTRAWKRDYKGTTLLSLSPHLFAKAPSNDILRFLRTALALTPASCIK